MPWEMNAIAPVYCGVRDGDESFRFFEWCWCKGERMECGPVRAAEPLRASIRRARSSGVREVIVVFGFADESLFYC